MKSTTFLATSRASQSHHQTGAHKRFPQEHSLPDQDPAEGIDGLLGGISESLQLDQQCLLTICASFFKMPGGIIIRLLNLLVGLIIAPSSQPKRRMATYCMQGGSPVVSTQPRSWICTGQQTFTESLRWNGSLVQTDCNVGACDAPS